MPNTQTILLDQIWQQMSIAGASTASIVLLADVAGSGKTALAHSVAQHCAWDGIFPASFFFDREIADRSNPYKLISSFAHHLASFHPGLAREIDQAIIRQPDLPMASLAHQFEYLVLNPLLICIPLTSVVWVIDALDEGYNSDILDILAEEISKLLGIVCIFVVTRLESQIMTSLQHKSHVSILDMDIHGGPNLKDMELYAEHQLQNIVNKRLQSLPESWPDEKLLKQFIQKAEGLPLWIATVSDYLCLPTTTNPNKKLRMILADQSFAGNSLVEKMDALYAKILHFCNWKDEDFTKGY